MEKTIQEAMKIVSERAEKENRGYNVIAVYWRLRGIYEREGKEAVMQFAKTAEFQKEKKRRAVGYS